MGSWGTLGPAVLSLAGVALGAAGSLFGQYLVSRASHRQLETQQNAEHRAEVKDVILKFLEVAFRVEKAASAVPDGEEPPEALLDELWLAQAELDLAARTEPLRGAAHRYAVRLTSAARGEGADGDGLYRAKVAFMDAAYDDLWPSSPRSR
ncbi:MULTISPECIES: hypothetical protein [Streptomyces]|uniref:hypothetical protein n=1 Tax=Streptomyces TaxID=1883 RepID=UPI001FC9BAA0|nr:MULTISPECIES: hypothetical protein [Streptomyces]